MRKPMPPNRDRDTQAGHRPGEARGVEPIKVTTERKQCQPLRCQRRVLCAQATWGLGILILSGFNGYAYRRRVLRVVFSQVALILRDIRAQPSARWRQNHVAQWAPRAESMTYAASDSGLRWH